ncbi:MAG: VWA domain-containing protein [Acidobacteriota bacterium]
MKKRVAVLSLILAPFLFAAAKPQQHDVTVRNITVPVRVFDNNIFVDTLTLDDFEILENGIPQKPEALYLVRQGNIQRKEENVGFFPSVGRQFFLLFQLIDYNPKLADAMKYFFTEILQEDDLLTIQTPLKNYNLPPGVLKSRPREVIAKDLVDIIRKDTSIGSSYYKNQMRELKRIIRSIQSSGTGLGRTLAGEEMDSTNVGFSLDFLLPRYKETMEKMENLRMVEEKRFLQFAEALKQSEGEKTVFLFYQREYRPEINQNYLSTLMSMVQDQPNNLSDLQDIFSYHRDISIDGKKLQQAFSDASIHFNFIFMNSEPDNITGITMIEQSEDIFRAFSDVAKATGGMTDTSQNPFTGIKNASALTDQHYLLYYSPANYSNDGEFKTIQIKIKDKSYKVFHRQGYIAK